MATVKENKETITRSRLVGLKDICVAAVTTNDEDVYAADVPVRLAKAIAATVKDTFSVEYTYSDDEVEDTVETYEKTEIELEVNRLTPGDYALLFDTLYKYGFLAKAEGDKAKEVALGFRAKQGNGKYEFSWYYCGKAEGVKEKDRTGKKGYGMGLACRKIPDYYPVYYGRKIRRTVRRSIREV